MTCKTFIDALAAETGKTKKDTKEFMDAFEVVLKKSVGPEPLKVADLTFTVKDVAERNGVNPKTQEHIVIPATKKLSVKPSANFKSLVKE